MKRVLVVIATLLAGACSASPSPSSSSLSAFPAGTLVDLSHSYDAQTIFWPTAERFRLEKVADGITPGGWYYAANNFFTAEHGGTHIDAPVHFAQGRWTVDQIPLDRLIGNAIVLDVSAASTKNADYQVPIADFTAWEQAHGQIEPDSIVLIRTDFAKRWPDAQTYLGTAERGGGAVAKLHFPGLHPDAAKWLVERKVKAVGLDTASIDYGQSTLYESHRILYERNIPAFENLTALDQLPTRGAVVYALPIKIKGGSGGPLRAIAVVPTVRVSLEKPSSSAIPRTQ
jgi:kynurenine formamidase